MKGVAKISADKDRKDENNEEDEEITPSDEL